MDSLKLYAETPALRLRQVLLDVGLVVWVFVWVRIGLWLKDLVQRLEGPGRSIEDAGNQIAGWRVPILDRRLGPITSGGEALQRAGDTQQDVVHSLAFWLALLLAAIPIVCLMARYFPGRLRWAREATAASRIRAEPSAYRLFALRAMANRPLGGASETKSPGQGAETLGVAPKPPHNPPAPTPRRFRQASLQSRPVWISV
ncbi:MAG TPA: hypothetical protein VK988_08445 [Acidimicrobiales bacterium]|nr:hypothetical protein [Acidimicrobiales bacterium]